MKSTATDSAAERCLIRRSTPWTRTGHCSAGCTVCLITPRHFARARRAADFGLPPILGGSKQHHLWLEPIVARRASHGRPISSFITGPGHLRHHLRCTTSGRYPDDDFQRASRPSINAASFHLPRARAQCLSARALDGTGASKPCALPRSRLTAGHHAGANPPQRTKRSMLAILKQAVAGFVSGAGPIGGSTLRRWLRACGAGHGRREGHLAIDPFHDDTHVASASSRIGPFHDTPFFRHVGQPRTYAIFDRLEFNHDRAQNRSALLLN